MSMNFIDISGWQRGLNLVELFSKNPNLHGVIVKSTGGSSYVQATCDPWVQTLIQLGKPWGFYHYLNDDGRRATPEQEAEHFVNSTKNYFGKGVPFADFEDQWAVAQGPRYLKRFLDKVTELTGVKPVVYTGRYVIMSNRTGFQEIVNAGYALWLAQYANYTPTGFQDTPWQNGDVLPWKSYMMHQYSSSGRLNGWNGNLDLDKFYGDLGAWNAYVGSTGNAEAPVKEEVKFKDIDVNVIASVFSGSYSSGEERKKRLQDDGYDPSAVQKKINELYELAKVVKPVYKKAGEYWAVMSGILSAISE